MPDLLTKLFCQHYVNNEDFEEYKKNQLLFNFISFHPLLIAIVCTLIYYAVLFKFKKEQDWIELKLCNNYLLDLLLKYTIFLITPITFFLIGIIKKASLESYEIEETKRFFSKKIEEFKQITVKEE